MAATPAPVASASLYVGDLDREVTEAQLYELFSQVGPVASIRVCRDAVTRRSLGYAYVNYNSTVDESAAERALEALNYQAVNGRPMRIMWSHRDPSARRSGVGNIFIKNLDETIDHKALHDTFQQFGNILSCKVAMLDGQSRGFGFVHFETEEAANLAIEKVNGMLMEGKKVFVGKFLKKSERDPDQTQHRFTNIFVKNLDLEVTEETLQEKFGEVGKITNLVIMRDEMGKSRGFGFVNYENPDSARAAVDTLNQTEIGSKMVYVGRAQKKAEREQMLRVQFEEKRQERLQKYQGVNLYIKNLDDTVDDEKLASEFEPFGAITSAKVMKDDKGNSRGFGFVCFSSPEEAAKAVAEASGRMVLGKPLYVALAQRKEVRRAQLEQQYAVIRGVTPMMRTVYPPGAQPMFYTPAPPPGVLMPPPGPGGPQRQGMMYQPMMPRSWRPGPMPPPGMRPAFPAPPIMAAGYGQPQPPPQLQQQQQGQGQLPLQQQVQPQQQQQQQPQQQHQQGGRGQRQQGRQRGTNFQQQQQANGLPQSAAAGAPSQPARNQRQPQQAGQGQQLPQQQQQQFNKFGPNGRPFTNANGAPPMGQMPMGQQQLPHPPPQAMLAGNLPDGMAMPLPMVPMPGGMPLVAGPMVAGQALLPGGAPALPMLPGVALPVPLQAGGVPEALNSTMLAAAPPDLQKQMLGERLFPLIQRHQPELAGKITGMLLEMDNSELLLLLESPEALLQKIEEALLVLRQHGGSGARDGEDDSAEVAGGGQPAPADGVAPPAPQLVEAQG
eukprot:TRINITY_DN29496_c0_g1_i1.p1 TRINITY_DN29496_c0_g1~~TRINITY_DN29496_c0_g1_i1.p1  ORF type:complete len:779 (+),score=217.99 TRINITY_DN29496_c0_g1_i1:291-2627(+)